MPSLKQIYDDAINTVEKEPEKIGAHFWLALTASRMMQESNDDSMNYSYADVGSKYFEYQNDPAFRKAMKVYGETQSMERMKEPGSFWKIYDVFDDDLDREPVEDIRKKELEAYDNKTDEFKRESEKYSQQYADYMAQMTALPQDSPERHAASLNADTANKMKKRQLNKSKALTKEQVRRCAALLAANEKNGGVGAVSPAELEESLAELKKDPYFEAKLESFDASKLVDVIDDPTKFYEEYKYEKGIYNELAQLREKKDYKGLVDRFEQLIEEPDLNKMDLNERAIGACIRDNIPKVAGQKEFDDKTKEFIDGLSEELSSRMAENCLAVRRTELEMRQRVRNGEFPETRLVDDENLLDKIAGDLVRYQTDTGAKMDVYSTLQETFNMSLTADRGADKGSINGVLGREYVNKKINAKLIDTYQKNAPEFLKGMEEYGDGGEIGFLKDQWFFQPIKGRGGFDYKKNRVKPGESVFEKIPPLHDKLLKMTPEEFAAFEYKEKQKRALDAEIPKKFKDFSKKADYLIEELEEKPDDVKESNRYQMMYAELKNFQKLGTPGFVIAGDLSDKRVNHSSVISRVTLNKALSRLERQAESYKKVDPEFAKKVEGFVWEQKTVNKKYLENDPLLDEDYRYINSVKNVREELKDVKFDENADIASRQSKFGGADGKLAQLRQKYNKSKVLLGKSEYDRVGKALGWLETSFRTLEESEEKLYAQNRQDDPESNNVMLKAVQDVIEDLELLKDADNDYFEHKKKDGQWVGNNKSANKRIGTVKEIDGVADELQEIMKKKAEMLMKRIRAKTKENAEVQQQAQPQPQPQPAEEPKQPAPEEVFRQNKAAFEDKAAEIWLKNKFVSSIDEEIDKWYPQYNKQQRQQVHANHAYKLDGYIKDNMEPLKNDEAFRKFMDGIKNENDLRQMQQYADINKGEKLFRIINGEKVIENENVDLDKKVENAQEILRNGKSELAADEFPNPGNEKYFDAYATIVTAYYIKATKQALGDNITNETFNSVKKELKGQKAMRDVVNHKPEEVYNKATSGKGQNIWSEYSERKSKREARKKAPDNKKNVIKNTELNNGNKQIKQKGRN